MTDFLILLLIFVAAVLFAVLLRPRATLRMPCDDLAEAMKTPKQRSVRIDRGYKTRPNEMLGPAARVIK